MASEEPLCERCGAALPPAARFCPRCGAPVAILATQERKVVTVLFADLARSTELAARLDAERFREVMAAFFAMVSTELSSLRGRAEKFIGDAVMAVFGLPHAHDDDALRAIRAGLVVRERVGRLGEVMGTPIPLEVRVGINSGPVAAGAGLGDQFLVSGASVNLAVRLQEAADPGEVLVGETTWQLTRYAVGFGDPRRVVARGFDEQVTAWPVLSLSPRSARRTIPLVDRRREIALLAETFERVQEVRRAHLVTVLGEPGIGKSRLVEEFTASLPEGIRVLSGRASEFEEDTTFAPIADMIRRLLGVEEDTPATALRAKLRDVVEGCCEPSELDVVTARLGLVLGLGEQARESHRYRAAEVRAGLLALLRGLSRSDPVVLVFEDLHVARAVLLELLEDTVRQARRLPVLVLCIARDGLLENRPGWAGGIPDAITIRLEPLDLDDATELAIEAGESLDEPTAARIAMQAGGNPFFIVETTGMLLDEHVEHLAGVLHGHVLPPTVQAVVASRIDHLPEDARELVRKASVFARSTFSEDELSYIADPSTEILRALEDAELLVRDPERQGVWRFRHDMLRDVAYESLPKRERQRLHLRVADGLERDEPGKWPRAIAYHLEQAARAGLDLDAKDRTLAHRAVEALVRAGDLARWRMSSKSAEDLYERALSLAGPEESWGPREAHILASLGEARYWLGEYDDAFDVLERALDLAGDEDWTQALACRFLGDMALNLRGDFDEATAYFERALAAARRLAGEDAPWVLARVLLMAGWAPYWRGDLDAARTMFEEAREVSAGNAEDLWAQARALTSLTSVISPVGDEADCLELGREALELARKMREPFTTAVALQTVANSLRRMWRLDEARASIDEAVALFREVASQWELASVLGDRALVARYAGDLAGARADLREAFDICRRLRERSLITWTACELAVTDLLSGDAAGARQMLEEPFVTLASADPTARVAVLMARAIEALVAGDGERAVAQGLAALEETRREGWPNTVAALTWRLGRLLGADAVGGEAVLEEARRRLEAAHWLAAINEPDVLAAAVPVPS